MTRRYSTEPTDPEEFTRSFDRFYSRFARAYDVLVKRGPIWKGWLAHALPHVRGPRVLEVSCGTGYLLTQYAGRVQASAVDLNARMVEVTTENVRRAGLAAVVDSGARRSPSRTLAETEAQTQKMPNSFFRVARWRLGSMSSFTPLASKRSSRYSIPFSSLRFISSW